MLSGGRVCKPAPKQSRKASLHVSAAAILIFDREVGGKTNCSIYFKASRDIDLAFVSLGLGVQEANKKVVPK